MAIDARDAAGFYTTQLGRLTAGLLRRKLGAIWPDCAGQAVLGLGFAGPYLEPWREAAGRCIALSPRHMGVAPWPAGRGSLACLAEEDALPFPDLMFDRILLVHGLEAADNARRMLREVWRVLKDDGRLLVVAPNRRGLWAHVESTPFGHGQPYSPGQLGRLLAASLFRVERRDTALYLPPTSLRLVLRGARPWERIGRRLVPRLAGVTITEAVKDVYAAVPVRAVPRRRMVLADAG